MGWTFGWKEKEDMICHLRRNEQNVVAAKVVKDGLWRLTAEGRIYFDMFSYDDGEWGYKDQCVDMGIYNYDCPLGWLKKAVVDGYGVEWLAKAKLFHNLEACVGINNCIGVYKGKKLLIQTDVGIRWTWAKDFIGGLRDVEL